MLVQTIKQNAEKNNGWEHPAVVSDQAALTYAELVERVESFANTLRKNGIGPGHVVQAYLENVPAFIVTQLACTLAGCTFAPIDIGSTDAEIRNTLALTQSNLLVCDSSKADHCAQFTDNTLQVNAHGDIETVAFGKLPEPSLSDDIGCMQFSSGSTAASKGVLLSKEAFFYRSHYLTQTLELNRNDRTICSLPLSHTHGAECLALPTLLGTGTLYLKSPQFAYPTYILEELERLQITFFSSIPQFYDFAVKIEGKSPDLSSLRHPFCGSAALAKSTAEAFYEKYGVHIKQGYGLAELSVICINRHDTEQIIYDSIGKPIEGIEWRIEGDTDTEGELIVRSKAMFSGYINDEKNTREKLRNGWLHTGDLVSVDEQGMFRVIGRKEDFVKVNGFKVYAEKIEKAIIGIDWVKECAVLADKNELGNESIVAYLVPTDWSRDEKTMTRELTGFLRGKLSDYKIPKRLVAVKEFPKNPLGKILKSKIKDSLQE